MLFWRVYMPSLAFTVNASDGIYTLQNNINYTVYALGSDNIQQHFNGNNGDNGANWELDCTTCAIGEYVFTLPDDECITNASYGTYNLFPPGSTGVVGSITLGAPPKNSTLVGYMTTQDSDPCPVSVP